MCMLCSDSPARVGSYHQGFLSLSLPFHFILLFLVPVPIRHAMPSGPLCHQLDNTAGLCDLALGIFANVSSAYDKRDLGTASLSKKLGVSEG